MPAIAKPVVKRCDMEVELRDKILGLAVKVHDTESELENVASMIREKLVAAYPGNTWQVFVGRKFSTYVTHVKGFYLQFYLGQICFVIYACQ